jgi:hypothetical protein
MKWQEATFGLGLISSLLFVLHQYLQFIAQISMPFFDKYLDPALMMPILLHLLVWERRLIFRDTSSRLPESYIFGYFLLAVIFGELVFPYLSDKFIADYWDILSYALGSYAYAIAQRVSNSQSRML